MIKLTDNAKEKIIDVLIDEKATMLRFGLRGGGCSGFTYFFTIEEEMADDDIELPLDNQFKLVVDPMSMMYLEEAEIDYKRDIMGETFVFNNPQQKTACGCGNSVGF